MFERLLAILVGGLLATVWLYIIARLVTRAVIRTLEERKRETRNGQITED